MEQFAQELYNFYKRLQDDESRLAFKEKLLYFLDGDEDHNRVLIEENCDMDRIQKELKEIRELQKDGRKIVFYGAGIPSKNIKHFLNHHGITACAFCDRDINKQNTIHLGLPVISLEKLADDFKDAVIIITTISLHFAQIKHDLKKSGYSFVYELFYIENLPYFDHSFIGPPQNDEIYVDCGVLDGGTIQQFVDYSGGVYKKIYALEPDNSNYALSLTNLEQKNIQRVEFINKGVWSETTSLSFSDTGNGASHIDPDGSATVAVTAIDDIVGDDNVTFIKMDIEGAELQALKGAAKTISRCKPRLAICAYHKTEDILELSLYIQSLVPEYDFYLRPHSADFHYYVLYAQ